MALKPANTHLPRERHDSAQLVPTRQQDSPQRRVLPTSSLHCPRLSVQQPPSPRSTQHAQDHHGQDLRTALFHQAIGVPHDDHENHSPYQSIPNVQPFPTHITFPSVLWRLLTPAPSAPPLKQNRCTLTSAALGQASPDKNIHFPLTATAFTHKPFNGGTGFDIVCCLTPTCMPDAIRVPRCQDLPPASFPPHLAMTQLLLAKS
ncbi:hypothetical protein JOF28_001051 [Leucobacter exalbidus]|uniref:Uncharacterized protein n=1 Tax=Leucobacter exalbidus TaxID=662960 RepID=A0A940PQN7_9MICO|nr:hypothetical protein [Leucobacter exalbidus]